MNFINDFPNLFQFFGGYFPDADFDNLTDENVVMNYVIDCNKSEVSKKALAKAKEELSILIIKIDSYWEDLESETNRYFEGPQDALNWLNMVWRELNK